MDTFQLAALLAGYARPNLPAEAADRRRASVPGDSSPRVRARRARRRPRVLAFSGRRLEA